MHLECELDLVHVLPGTLTLGLLARCGGFWGDRVMRQLPHFPTS